MSKKIVFVHCHPDDEVITTGSSIAKFINMGHDVTVINFSSGDSGNSYLPEYERFSQAFKNKLLNERENALKELGVKNHLFIGPYHDTYPFKNPRNPECLTNQDTDKLAKELYDVLIKIKPDLLITYDSKGWSGHPDHIKINKVTMETIKMLDAEYYIPNVWFTVIKNSLNPSESTGEFEDRFWLSSYVIPNIELDCSDTVNKKISALQQYETQIKVYEDYWTLCGMENYKIPHFDKEWFNIYRGTYDYQQF